GVVGAEVVFDFVGIVSVDHHWEDHRATLQEFANELGVHQFLHAKVVLPIGRAALLQLPLLVSEVGILGNEAGRNAIFSKRENPNPALLFLTHVDDDRESFFESAAKLDTAPVRPDRGPIELLTWLAPAILCANESIAPACVDEKSGAMESLLAVQIQALHRNPVAHTGNVR